MRCVSDTLGICHGTFYIQPAVKTGARDLATDAPGQGTRSPGDLVGRGIRSPGDLVELHFPGIFLYAACGNTVLT